MTPRRPFQPEVGPPKIQVGRFDMLVRRLFGIKQLGVVSHVDPCVQSSVDILLGQYTDQLLSSAIYPWWAAVSQGALAANRGIFHLQNPAGSGMLVTIAAGRGKATAGATMFSAWWVSGFLTSTNPVAVRPRDTRQWLNSVPPQNAPNNPIVLSSSNVPSATSFPTFIGAVNSYQLGDSHPVPALANVVSVDELQGPIVLGPGAALSWDAGVANALSTLELVGTIRPVDAPELAIR